jgi:hypothetical protein
MRLALHHSERIIRWLIRAIDFLLCQLTGIMEFDHSEDTLIRIEFERTMREVWLPDGTHLQPGDVVIELHFWNEHLLRIPSWGPNFCWARVTRRRALQSLCCLARYMRTDHRCDEVKALRIMPAVRGGRRAHVLTRIAARHGFEADRDDAAELAGSPLFRLFDNLWLWLLAWTFNPTSLKGWRFDRRRRQFWMSRARFMALYGDQADGPVRAPST